jgi:hypothetical protein
MPTREGIVLLASYNASMNSKLYAAAATLPKDVLSADRGAFFGSVLGTVRCKQWSTFQRLPVFLTDIATIWTARMDPEHA